MDVLTKFQQEAHPCCHINRNRFTARFTTSSETSIVLQGKPRSTLSVWLVVACVLCSKFGMLEGYILKGNKALPVRGYPYWVRATLINRPYEHSVYRENITFMRARDGKSCVITNWKFCADLTMPTRPWQCHCSSRRVESPSGDFLYRFGLLLETITLEHSTDVIQVYLQKNNDRSINLQVVDFTGKRPISSVCNNKIPELGWNFSPRTNDVQNSFKVKYIRWFFEQKGGVIEVANITMHARDRSKDIPWTQSSKIHIKILGNFYKLEPTYVKTNQTIRIKVEFDQKHFLNELKKDRAIFPATALEWGDWSWSEYQLRHQKQTNGGGSESFNNRNPNQNRNPLENILLDRTRNSDNNTTQETITNLTASTAAATTTPTTTTEGTTTTTTTTTNVPQLTYPAEIDQLYALQDSITLRPRTPPEKALLKIDFKEGLSGNAIVTCRKVSSSVNLGVPKVNLTLWQKQGDKPKEMIMTRSVIDGRISVSVRNRRDLIFTCSYTGQAVDCMDPTELRDMAESVNSTVGLNFFRKKKVTPFVILYFLEMLALISLILWVIANALEHVRLLLWQKRLKLEHKQQMMMLEKPIYFNRDLFYEPKNVPPPRRRAD